MRHGKLAGSTTTARRRPDALHRGTAGQRRGRGRRRAPCPAATPEESEKILRWLERPGVRIVEVDGAWTCPVGGSAPVRAEAEPLETARREVAGFAGVR